MAWTHTHDWKLAAPPDEVFAAFTEAARLKAWFADEVELSAKSGGDFRFWGKRTLGAPTAGEATQRFRSVTAGEGLAFSWTILGVPTTVSVMLGKNGKGTKMQISHTVEGEFAVPRQREARAPDRGQAGRHGRCPGQQSQDLSFQHLGRHLWQVGACRLKNCVSPSCLA